MDDAKLRALGASLQAHGTLYLAELEYYLQGRLNVAARDMAASTGSLFFDGEAVVLADKKQ